ncbi:MAG: hypothetical protein OZSIB_2725 [Candidatus Ozemobacter sibiricus]|jgi:hypothetical protein|uniref:Uncharacterized protein n=1 Tax=Candidatus Ozemobacter sibiricus TaxID=2268124 RepID=A0A367ZSM1_9BACT|nr:MAG: hypothetical protein OZSIB_2725 [Candidatus Ozemobacter sibiricus]
MAWSVLWLLVSLASAASGTSLPDLVEMQERFAQLYQCPADRGLATFSATIVSEQITYLAGSLGLPAPDLRLTFDGFSGFEVDYDREALLAREKGSLLADAADAIKNAAEGFFQAYESLAFRNLCTHLPATPTISLAGENVVLAYPDRTPGQTVHLTFSPEFRLLVMEARDAPTNAAHRMMPRWVMADGRFVLVAVEVEFIQDGASAFHSLFKVENQSIDGIFLPSRVTMHARDGGLASTKNALMEFQVTGYALGRSRR